MLEIDIYLFKYIFTNKFMASVQSTESTNGLPTFQFKVDSEKVFEKQITNQKNGSIEKIRILSIRQQAGNILPSEFRIGDVSEILEQIRASSKLSQKFSEILSQIQGMKQEELEKFLDQKFLGENISYNEDRWRELLTFFRKPDGSIDYEKLAAWIVYNLDHLKGVSTFRDSLFFDEESLEPGVWGQLFKFIPSDTNSKSTTISLQGNLSLTIYRDSNGDFFISSRVEGLSQPGKKTYITTQGIVLYEQEGQLYGIFVQSKEKLAEIYESLRENRVDTIYYLYSGDRVKGNVRENGIRLEILSDTFNRPEILSDREQVKAVYHGNRIIQSFHALEDGRPVIVQIATMKDTRDVIYQQYRIVEANRSYNIYEGWQRLSEESFNRGHLARVRLQDGTELKDRIMRHRIAGDKYLYFAPVYDFEKRNSRGNLISTYTLPYRTSGADHILDYSRSQQELVFQAHNRYVEGSDVKLLYSLNRSAKVVIVDREGRMFDINANFIGTYSDNLTHRNLKGVQDVRGGFYRPPRNGDRIIAISEDGQKKEIKLYPETVGFKLQTYNPDPITRDINGTILSDQSVPIAEIEPYENSKLGSLRISVSIPNYASGSESKQPLTLKQDEDFIYKDGKIYLTKTGLEKLSKISSDDVILSVEVGSVVSHQNNKEVPGFVSITQTQNLTLRFQRLNASIQQQGQEVVGIKKEGNQYSFTTNPTVLTISPGPDTVIENYENIQVSYYENGKLVPLERGYEVRQKDGNIEIVLTDPSLIALHQQLLITGKVGYRNKDGRYIETQTINHRFSVGVLGFELQTYNPEPVKIDIGDTIILPGRNLPIARLEPLKGNKLDNLKLKILIPRLEDGELILEQNKHFVYENDGTISLTTEGVKEILSKIGSSNVNDIFNVDLLIQVQSKVSHNQYQQIPASSITQQGPVTLSFQRLRASIQQQGQEVVGIKKEGNQYSFTTNPTVLIISPGPDTVIDEKDIKEIYENIRVGYKDENGNWVAIPKESYKLRLEGGSIKLEFTDPSLLALYSGKTLTIQGQVRYGNINGTDRLPWTSNHTFSVRLEEVKYALELKAPQNILEGAIEPEVPFTVKTDAPSYEVYFNGQKIEGNTIPTQPGVLTVRLPNGQEASQKIGIEPASASMPKLITVTTQRGDTREQQSDQIIKKLEEALRIQLSTNLTLAEERIEIKIDDGKEVKKRVLTKDQYRIDGNVITFSEEFLKQIAATLILTNPNLKLEVSFLVESKNRPDTFGTRRFELSSNISMLRQEAQQTQQLDIKPLEPPIPSIIAIDVTPTVKEFGQNTGGLMGANARDNVGKAQQAASALAQLLFLLNRGGNDPKKLEDLSGKFKLNVDQIQFYIPVSDGSGLFEDLLQRVLTSPNGQNPPSYIFSLGDLITLAKSNDDAKALLGAVLLKDYTDSGASEDDLRRIGDTFIQLYDAILNKRFEAINEIIAQLDQQASSYKNSLLYALLPSSVESTLIVETEIAKFRINLGEISGKINESIDYLVRVSAILGLGIAEITKMSNDKQEQTSLLVLSPGIGIKSVVRENGKYVFELDASALVKFGIGSESKFLGYRLEANARGELTLIEDKDIAMKIKPQASVSVTNALTSLSAGVDAFVYIGREIRVESSGISIRPIVLYGGINGNLLSSTYDARFGAAYNTQLGPGILTLQGQYNLGRGWLLGASYSTGDFASQFSYDLKENKFKLGIEIKF